MFLQDSDASHFGQVPEIPKFPSNLEPDEKSIAFQSQAVTMRTRSWRSFHSVADLSFRFKHAHAPTPKEELER